MEVALNEWLWRQEYWLPPGITWEDMQDTEWVCYPRPRHLLLSLPLALAFIAVRLLFERYVAVPLSRQLGVKEKSPLKPTPNCILEIFYITQNKSPTESQVCSLSQQCGLHTRHVERWFRRRRNQDRPSMTKKFCEASWRFVFYFHAFFGGLIVLHDKSWFWDQREFWVGYPQQPLLPVVYWYYVLELGFYWSLLLTMAFDVKRKDHQEQIVHHFTTIFLISFSYCANYVRAGTLVMVLHDCADYVLELAKMFNYTKWKRVCDVLFIFFALIFIITRLILLPSRVIYSTYYYSMEIFQPFFGYYFFNALLMILQLLHVFWAYLILRMVYRFTFVGTIEKDVRSDAEESDDIISANEEEKPRKKNGTVGFQSATSNGLVTDWQMNAARLTNGHSKLS
ncbi:ceramide synthase 4 isoform X1 [Rhinatrema bivittatum]|uniref:ceramide synthase 4 isoform X1 n=1 Tax=Rhinatrema bivittatum TaxID=194408 RepID=UPI00112D879B|nr:ceramide synthase 4 isoform X1 [Rhinatrema bivittatum]XP_029466660.1 ceramide synthase 4 isoform X1 [Rhinatrema bivittatum]